MNIAAQHYPELARCIIRYGTRQTDEGLLIPRADVLASGLYLHGINGQNWQEDPNLVTEEGLYYLLGAAFNQATRPTDFYIALFGGAITPLSSWNAANFAATASEITSATDGYSESTRVKWEKVAAANLRVDNFASKSRFTFTTSGAAPVKVEGAALLSESAKGAASGLLISAARFAAPRELHDGDTFDIGYGIALAG